MAVYHPAAAWIPHDLARDADEDDAAYLEAIQWITTHTTEYGAPVLVANALDSAHGTPLDNFARGYGITTWRSKDHPGRGPVLVYLPDERTLTYATRLAHSSPIAVIEGMSLSLTGWAAAAKAVNLLEPEEPPLELDPQVLRELERLEFHKNNAWGDTLGKKAARQCLDQLHQLGFSSRGTIKSWLIAHGANGARMNVLDTIMDRLGFPDDWAEEL